ncbi:SDR family NAD(P)-dependent oxidoreductase [Flavisphingomonas formosensis]|uniref:SDR family NAD(P)-dependent oxidoreductase n=1 Tax=Flavisphingomonas formosensis TaxID=861534 RepID=UPI001E57DAD7|nr:SDR family oxidoreductase [Sphingomonas formosensis]
MALVTGGARGIGAATARLFVAEGARVAIADRRAEEAAALVAEIEAAHPGAALFVPLDVTSETDWQSAVERIEAAFGPIGVLVNNAGIIRVAPIEALDVETFRKVIDTNLVGTFLGIRCVTPSLRRAGGGSIVNFSSVQGLEGRQGFGAYAASKFGIRGLTRSAAIELGPDGIRVNAVVPGPTKTKMIERPGWSDADYDAMYGKYPLMRMADAQEVARMVLFLASDQSSFCTGGDYLVDGGTLAGKPRD